MRDNVLIYLNRTIRILLSWDCPELSWLAITIWAIGKLLVVAVGVWVGMVLAAVLTGTWGSLSC